MLIKIIINFIMSRFHTTSLMIASREGHVTAVRELIRLGADVNSQDSRGWTVREARKLLLRLVGSEYAVCDGITGGERMSLRVNQNCGVCYVRKLYHVTGLCVVWL